MRSHQRFAAKRGYQFDLLSDEGAQLAQACGIWVEKKLYGKTYMGVARTTYLLDAEGIVREIWRSVVPQGHAEEVCASIRPR